MDQFIPPTIEPPTRPLGVLPSLRAIRQNALSVLPGIAYEQPIVSGITGFRKWHMVQGPEGLKQVFLDNVDNYPKSEVVIRMLRSAVGESLFTSEGANWRWQRRAIAPVFSARNVSSLAPIMTRTAERASERIGTQPSSNEIMREMISATFDVICEVALSGRDHFDAEEYGAAITQYMLTAGRSSLLDFLDAPQWIPRPGEILGRGAVRTMHRMVTRAIEARRRETTFETSDLLDYMLVAEDPATGRRMTSLDLMHNLQFFIVAGHETTALALSWSLYLLSHDQGCQARAHEEARSVLSARAASVDDLSRMPYIEQVLHEAMRLYPPVGFLARKALKSDEIYDRKIQAGDTVFLNIYGLHRHKLWWERPEMFDPENFALEKVERRDRFQYVPFGAGPRICVGANFAMMQAQIILSTLLARFRFVPIGPPPKPVMHMTIRPDPGVTLQATRI